jgi:hypothetical protein
MPPEPATYCFHTADFIHCTNSISHNRLLTASIPWQGHLKKAAREDSFNIDILLATSTCREPFVYSEYTPYYGIAAWIYYLLLLLGYTGHLSPLNIVLVFYVNSNNNCYHWLHFHKFVSPRCLPPQFQPALRYTVTVLHFPGVFKASRWMSRLSMLKHTQPVSLSLSLPPE